EGGPAPRHDRRAPLEAEFADLTRSYVLSGRRRDAVVPQPVRRHPEAIRLLVVSVEPEIRLSSPRATLPCLGAVVREADPELCDGARRHHQVVGLTLPG